MDRQRSQVSYWNLMCVLSVYFHYFYVEFCLEKKISFPKHSLGLRAPDEFMGQLITVCIFQSYTVMAVHIIGNMLFELRCGWLQILCVLNASKPVCLLNCDSRCIIFFQIIIYYMYIKTRSGVH